MTELKTQAEVNAPAPQPFSESELPALIADLLDPSSPPPTLLWCRRVAATLEALSARSPGEGEVVKTMTPELEAKVDAAEKAIAELCQGQRGWRMGIPARPTYDDDLVISDAIRSLVTALRSRSVAPPEPSEAAMTAGRTAYYKYTETEGPYIANDLIQAIVRAAYAAQFGEGSHG